MATVGVKRWLVPGAKFVVLVAMVCATLFTLEGGTRLSIAGLALLATGVIAAGNWALARDPLYPPFALGMVWGGTLLFYSWVDAGLPRLHAETGALLVLGYLAFSLGGVLSCNRRMDAVEAGRQAEEGRAGWVGRWVVVAALAGLPLFIYKAYQIGQGGLTENFMINLRRALTEEDEGASMGLAAYGASIAVFGSALSTAGVANVSRIDKLVLFVTALVYAFFSTGRTLFLLLFVATGAGLAIRRRVKLRTVAMAGGGAFALAYLLVGFIMGKLGGDDRDGATGLVETLQAYLLGGLAAFDDVVVHPKPPTGGEVTFRFLHAMLNRLDLGPPPVKLVQEFREVGVVTNVYTVHRPYYDDFSWPGVLIAQVAFGWIHSWAYFQARRGRRAMVYVYAILMYPLIMQFFQDQYFNILSTWVQALLLLAVVGWCEHARHRAPPELNAPST